MTVFTLLSRKGEIPKHCAFILRTSCRNRSTFVAMALGCADPKRSDNAVCEHIGDWFRSQLQHTEINMVDKLNGKNNAFSKNAIQKERRQLNRYQPPDKTFVAVSGQDQRIGQIVNINQMGLLFQYLCDPDGSAEFKKLSEIEIIIFNTMADLYLSDIRGALLYEENLKFQKLSFSYIPMKRCGIKFTRVPTEHLQVLDRFISKLPPYQQTP